MRVASEGVDPCRQSLGALRGRLESLNRHRLVLAGVLALLSLAAPLALSQDSSGGNAVPDARNVQDAPAPEPDPLASDACQLARQALQLALSAAAENPHDKAAQLAQARERTALACLGAADSSLATTRSRQPALVVPPIVPAAPAPHVIATPLPPMAIPRAPVITACDAGGCWDSNGQRLQRAGPELMGPHGPCIAQGQSFNCP
jgi:hypothetical protein